MGPGSEYVLGGPVYWFMVILLVLAGMLSAFVVLDSLRRRLRDRDVRPAGSWWVYVVPQAVYFVLLLVVQADWLPLIASAVLVALTPFALVQQVVYLLRVVFPKQPAKPIVAEEDSAQPPGE